MSTTDLENTILEMLSGPNYKPIKPRMIAKKLGLDEDSGKAVKKAVKRLVKSGRAVYGVDHLVGRADGDGTDRMTGVFRRVQGGYGFVIPPATAQRSDEKKTDVFIAARNALDAHTGDTVLVRLSKAKGRGGNPEGKIVRVIERETNQFVGTYFVANDYGYVQVDGRVFSQPVLVGDPGAKGARDDDKVVLEIVRFPSHAHDGEGVIVEVLGARGDPGVDTLSIIREHNLPGEFPEDVLEDARAQAEAFDESITGNRRDLTAETIITIDPADARDFDDAISLARLENGHWLLGVHIADVAHFVPRKTPLDREAHERATSVYLPDQVIPMLPEIISNNLASLQPDRVRYAKTVQIEYTSEGVYVGAEFCRSAIESKRRFTYEEIDDYLASAVGWKKKLTPEVHSLVGRMHELAMTLRKRRFRRGSLELSMPEVKVDLDKEGRVSGAHLVENTESHQIIEEFMLAANEAVAEILHSRELSFMRRVHEAPDPRKLKALTEFVKELGIKTESLESRFELQKLLANVEGKPEQHAVNYAVLRSMQKAVYSPLEEGHYALASECYCHFTSPIRRYPDMLVHRLLDELIDGRTPQINLDELITLGEHCSEREQRAAVAERELIKLKLLHYMEGRIGEEMDAVVTGVEQYGLFARGVELPAEGLIHVNSLQDDYYHFDRASRTLMGRRQGSTYRLGDLVRVAVARVDIDQRELDLRIVGHKRRETSSETTPRRSPGGRGASQSKSRSDRGRGDSSGQKPREGKSTRKPDGKSKPTRKKKPGGKTKPTGKKPAKKGPKKAKRGPGGGKRRD